MLRKLVERVRGLASFHRPGTPATGDPARAVVVYYFGDEPEAGVRKDWYWRKVELRLADDPPDGPTTTVEAYLVKAAHQALRTGADIPVRLKPGTRTIVGIDVEAYEAEVAAAAAAS